MESKADPSCEGLLWIVEGQLFRNLGLRRLYYAGLSSFRVALSQLLTIKVAEGVRFELTRPFGLPVFKTGAINRSATPPENY